MTRAICMACGAAVLANRIEWHHIVPQRLGLETEVTVPLCIQCHDEIDRVPLDEWDPVTFARGARELWATLGPEARLVLLKLFSIYVDELWKRAPDRVRRIASALAASEPKP